MRPSVTSVRRLRRSLVRGSRFALLLLLLLVIAPRVCRGQPTADSTLLGRASCAANTCHGGVVGRGADWRSSLSRWMVEDPHVHAGTILNDAVSDRIIVTLYPAIADRRGKGEVEEAELAKHNVIRKRCLSCHATVSPDECRPARTPLDGSILARGVSCESCHGAATDWLESHVTLRFGVPSGPTEAAVDAALSEKVAAGLRDNQTLQGRARGCVRCHVGSRREDGLVRDMNHDLIAAGHPVLRFELLAYDSALPSHWSRTPRGPIEQRVAFHESASRIRQVGRATTLAAAARLAAERAQDHLGKEATDSVPVPWPEFSDYDCYACHQSLRWDQYQVPLGERSPLRVGDGLPIWNSWHTVGQKKLSNLKALAPNHVNAAVLAKAGERLAGQFLAQARAVEVAAPDPPQVTLERIRSQLERVPEDWHEAAVVFLDLDAVLRDQPRRDPGVKSRVEPIVEQLRGSLQFGESLASPRDFDYEQANVFRQQALKLIHALLPHDQPIP